MAEKTDQIVELKRRGYAVYPTPGGYLVEKKGFWGDFAYDTSTGQERFTIALKTWLLVLVYFLGILGYLYLRFAFIPACKKEVTSVMI